MYSFDWATPAFGGMLGACHAVDIPFAFDNLDASGVAQLTGDGPERAAVADAYSGAVLAFARDGDPGWPALRHRHAGPCGASTCDTDRDRRPGAGLRELWARRLSPGAARDRRRHEGYHRVGPTVRGPTPP